MERSLKNKIMFIIGALLLLSAAGLLLFSNRSRAVSEKMSEGIISAFDEIVVSEQTAPNGLSGEMPVLSINGTDVIGKLTIPSCSISVPIADDEKFGITHRVSGSMYDNDLVLFGSTNDLLSAANGISLQDEIDLTDAQGNTFILEAEHIAHTTDISAVDSSACALTIIVKNELDMSFVVISCSEQ